jgi:predicted RNA binding protein YcfA (HicA-like mRNA interferase family)
MARGDKLKAKLLSGQHDKNFNLGELCTLLEQLGFSERNGKGSHRIFRREGIEEIINLQPARDGKAKPYQVQIVRGIVQAYNL